MNDKRKSYTELERLRNHNLIFPIQEKEKLKDGNTFPIFGKTSLVGFENYEFKGKLLYRKEFTYKKGILTLKRVKPLPANFQEQIFNNFLERQNTKGEFDSIKLKIEEKKKELLVEREKQVKAINEKFDKSNEEFLVEFEKGYLEFCGFLPSESVKSKKLEERENQRSMEIEKVFLETIL